MFQPVSTPASPAARRSMGRLALAALASDPDQTAPATQGRIGAAQFFFHYELPKIGAWLQVVSTRDATCAAFPEEAF